MKKSYRVKKNKSFHKILKEFFLLGYLKARFRVLGFFLQAKFLRVLESDQSSPVRNAVNLFHLVETLVSMYQGQFVA